MTIRRIAIWIAFLAFLLVPLWSLGFLSSTAPEPAPVERKAVVQHAEPSKPALTVRGVPFTVEVADTPARQAQGLSGRMELGEREGLLFVFPQAGSYHFWMKDMVLALDMIWIGDDLRIVDLTENATPDSYPKTFTSRAPARYVFEVPAGTVERENFAIGDPVSGTLLMNR